MRDVQRHSCGEKGALSAGDGSAEGGVGAILVSTAIAFVVAAFAVSNGASWTSAVALYISVGVVTLLMLGFRRAWVVRSEIAEISAHPDICQLTPQLEDRLFSDAERMMSAPPSDRGISLVVGADVERVLSLQRHLQDVGLSAMSCYHFPVASDWLDDFQIDDVTDAVDLVVVDAVNSDVDLISEFVRHLVSINIRLPVVVVVGFPSGVMDLLSGGGDAGRISFVPDSGVALKLAALGIIGDGVFEPEKDIQSRCI
ncbi:hypothetical protein [Pseudogemmobacter hezensis]|uniref:hypothetical protein n=1 Tax=Pseudogemmobacter hezensis TaxID=2737662 RepID=UPI001C1301F1|nr:hypothetical protein [Pseudogemmobacter hezensis]